MTSLDLARWQFGLTTLLHFAIVGVSIGLVFFVALLQTRYHRTGEERWLRLTQVLRRAMVLVVRGRRRHGHDADVPVRDELGGLLAPTSVTCSARRSRWKGSRAFFVESVFLGLWMFGGAAAAAACTSRACGSCERGDDVAPTRSSSPTRGCSTRSATRSSTGARSSTTSVRCCSTGPSALTTRTCCSASLLTGAVLVLAVACVADRSAGVRSSVRAGGADGGVRSGLGAALAAAGVGHFQGVLALRQQPMKMAAAEAHYETEARPGCRCSRSAGFAANPGPAVPERQAPRGAVVPERLLAGSTVRGINAAAGAKRRRSTGRATTSPVVGAHVLELPHDGRRRRGADRACSRWGCRLAATGRLERSRRFLRLAIVAAAMPFVAQAGGWLLREGGRQPWIVDGLLRTDVASSNVGVWAVACRWARTWPFYAVTFWFGGADARARARPRAAGAGANAARQRRPRADVLRCRARRTSAWFIAARRPVGAVPGARGRRLRRRHAAAPRSQDRRRRVLHAIGPTWAANEVWLVIAVVAMFGAFPGWYAAWTSGLYGVVLVIILALIVRHAGVELVGHVSARAAAGWTWAIVVSAGSPRSAGAWCGRGCWRVR